MDTILRRVALAVLCASFALAYDVPRPAADLTINYPDGHTARVADYRGKVVAMVFISTTCPHCQHTTEVLTRLQNKFGSRGFQVLEASLDPDAKTAVPRFVEQFHPSFPVGYVDRINAATFLKFSPEVRQFLPFFTIIDRGGTVRFEATGGDEVLSNEGAQEQNLSTEIQKVLDESARKHASSKHRQQ
jgi:cytochrome oxidase Cu insertion factor (SCO1/SenC/PrrC family)